MDLVDDACLPKCSGIFLPLRRNGLCVCRGGRDNIDGECLAQCGEGYIRMGRECVCPGDMQEFLNIQGKLAASLAAARTKSASAASTEQTASAPQATSDGTAIVSRNAHYPSLATRKDDATARPTRHPAPRLASP
eukprot:CAMPEP_0198318096 /NCGR_PEP_ID=MMETSP1450-20131203/7473_1 /TAXON_ID=753684 ORGANISM="Madagascaria erythrocladiodes, Strain CCMP3234" /NCGR_SAMPLE_ID=MMETSP1450 /ASSEMBLY_ACC=CAM_ASM_001115 /LENGTH=134 /DNA_ID=CAMNT_0044021365 /DNA_START=235 /DNA_END=637 /DNA_ORIENTATION=+